MFGPIVVLFVEEMLLVKLLTTSTMAMYYTDALSILGLPWVKSTTEQLRTIFSFFAFFERSEGVIYYCVISQYSELK